MLDTDSTEGLTCLFLERLESVVNNQRLMFHYLGSILLFSVIFLEQQMMQRLKLFDVYFIKLLQKPIKHLVKYLQH